ALFNVEGTFYAIDNTCTHRGGPLGEGELSGDTVTCPWHGAHFNVKTGAVTVPPARTGLRRYPIITAWGRMLGEDCWEWNGGGSLMRKSWLCLATDKP